MTENTFITLHKKLLFKLHKLNCFLFPLFSKYNLYLHVLIKGGFSFNIFALIYSSNILRWGGGGLFYLRINTKRQTLLLQMTQLFGKAVLQKFKYCFYNFKFKKVQQVRLLPSSKVEIGKKSILISLLWNWGKSLRENFWKILGKCLIIKSNIVYRKWECPWRTPHFTYKWRH